MSHHQSGMAAQAGGAGGGFTTGGGAAVGALVPPPSPLPSLVQSELTTLSAGEEPGIKLLPLPDKPEREFMVFLTKEQTAETRHMDAADLMVQVDVVLPDNYPTSPPSVRLPAGRLQAGCVDPQGVVNVPELLGATWVGVYGHNYGRQLLHILMRLKELFEPPSPAPAPGPAPAPAAAGPAAAGPAPAPAPAAQSTGKLFRVSVHAGKSRQAGGFMSGRALQRLRAAPLPAGCSDWRHTVTSESISAACRAIGEQGPTQEAGQDPPVQFRIWNLTDHGVTVTWPECPPREPSPGYNAQECENGKRLVRISSFCRACT